MDDCLMRLHSCLDADAIPQARDDYYYCADVDAVVDVTSDAREDPAG